MNATPRCLGSLVLLLSTFAVVSVAIPGAAVAEGSDPAMENIKRQEEWFRMQEERIRFQTMQNNFNQQQYFAQQQWQAEQLRQQRIAEIARIEDQKVQDQARRRELPGEIESMRARLANLPQDSFWRRGYYQRHLRQARAELNEVNARLGQDR